MGKQSTSGELPVTTDIYLNVLIPAKQNTCFDYLPHLELPQPIYRRGSRVMVPFGGRQIVGIIVGISRHSTVAPQRLKRVLSVYDETPLLDENLLALMEWASAYYHYPLGDALMSILPPGLRQGQATHPQSHKIWQLNSAFPAMPPVRSEKQKNLWELLRQHEQGLTEPELQIQFPNWRPVMKALLKKGWVAVTESTLIRSATPKPLAQPHPLNDTQQQAGAAICAAIGQYKAFLLDGVTGSGKTEVYLAVIETLVAQGRQCLVILPEIALTPQIYARFQARFNVPMVLLHSALTEKARAQAWLMAARAEAAIVIGTRSAVFVPMPNLSFIVIDEEHDNSLKQQEGFRYHARDVALVRASRLKIPVVMGSATPSLESCYNVQKSRYEHLCLPHRAGVARMPEFHLVDLHAKPALKSLSPPVLTAMKNTLAEGRQVLIFLNRRGYAPVMMCCRCGWLSSCTYCDAHMTFHRAIARLICHHCGASRALMAACPKCHGATLVPVGYGTQRLEEELQTTFPDVEIVRIDRDSTRRKGSLEQLLARVKQGGRQLLIGTQMLAKGHDFPNITCVVVLNADQGLYSADFRALERMAQMITQVAGRAGRGENRGHVYIQTFFPQHVLLQTLVKSGYSAFAQMALTERKRAQLPPAGYQALIRASGKAEVTVMAFLKEALEHGPARNAVEILGPIASPMERIAGLYRAQVLIQAAKRRELQQFLQLWLPKVHQLKSSNRVRWSVDVDPTDMM